LSGLLEVLALRGQLHDLAIVASLDLDEARFVDRLEGVGELAQRKLALTKQLVDRDRKPVIPYEGERDHGRLRESVRVGPLLRALLLLRLITLADEFASLEEGAERVRRRHATILLLREPAGKPLRAEVVPCGHIRGRPRGNQRHAVAGFEDARHARGIRARMAAGPFAALLEPTTAAPGTTVLKLR
jgi:hypothetical protein